ncbi:MAG: DNA cytosine methyltransferase [Terriglobales bacterium]
MFTGAGGMARGLSDAGFRHLALVERDHDSCWTLLENRRRGALEDWPLFESDVRSFDYSLVQGDVDLLAGGVPCQPFSVGGKHRGGGDPRNMFPEVTRAVRALRPKAVLLENVRGLLRRNFARYFGHIQLSLAYPEIGQREGETWAEHLGRLERYHTSGNPKGLFYRVLYRYVDAADYGVPQRRHRVFIVALRGDQPLAWSFPRPTHARAALLHSQIVTGEYWERHAIPKRRRPAADPRVAAGLLQRGLFATRQPLQPWRTVRDAIADLPPAGDARGPDEPGLTHFQVPGARSYPGHTGSVWDSPAKTLKAGDHGVPGGENMLAEDDGSVRYFTIRESARLQAFPDEFVFPGSWTESMRQVGNAVPVSLARVIGQHLSETLRRRNGPGTEPIQPAG